MNNDRRSYIRTHIDTAYSNDDNRDLPTSQVI